MQGLKLDAIYSSPFPRAVTTITPLAEALGKTVVQVEDLRERMLTTANIGDGWFDALERCWEDPDFAHEGGESNNQCQARVVGAVDRLAATHAGETIAAASHGNAISLFLQSIDASFGVERWRAMRNPDLFRVVYRNGRPTWDGQQLATSLPDAKK